MVGRRISQEHGDHLAIRTDTSRKYGHEERIRDTCTLDISRTASANSLAASSEDQNTTHLSASSAGESSCLSSSGFSVRSPARTSTSTMPHAEETGAATSPHPHPAITVIDLVSNSASASALPDGFDFAVSRKGTFIAVSGSSNIWLINASMLPRLFTRTLEIRRKPIALDILDDGSLLAVLSKPTQVDLYKLNGQDEGMIEKQRTLMLENEANTLALCPFGLILATGHKYGIEIFSLAPTASEREAESLRRTVACPPMDSLEFSDDGRTLLCTGYGKKAGASSTLFSVNGPYDGPFTEEGIPIQQDVDKAWISQILFPEKATLASQATLLPDSTTGQVNELFAFNSNENLWGIYDLASQAFTDKKIHLATGRNRKLPGEAFPAVSLKANYVAFGLGASSPDLCLCCLGEDESKDRSQEEKNAESPLMDSCFSLPVPQGDGLVHQEIGILRWVEVEGSPNVERLIAVGNVMVVGDNALNADGTALAQTSTGVVILMDFDSSKNKENEGSVPLKMTYDLDNILTGERLPEEDITFEREVELERTRTVAQRRAADRARDRRRSSGGGPVRAQTTTGRNGADRRPSMSGEEEELERDEAQALLEAPYDHSQPRSHMSLSRAATVAAVSPANRRHLRALPSQPLEYRRADGLRGREPPHESDADNWVPPPPPYTPKVDPTTSQPYSQTSTANSSAIVPNDDTMSYAEASMAATGSTRGSQRTIMDISESAIPPVPPLPAITDPDGRPLFRPGPYLRGSDVRSQSAFDLSLSGANSRPLLHTSTYPSSAQMDRRRSSAVAPPARGRLASYPSPQGSAYRDTASQQSAYHASATSVSRTRRLVPQGSNNPRSRHTVIDTTRYQNSGADLRPPSFANPFANLRRGSAPDVSHHARRSQIPGDPQQAPIARPASRPVSRREAMRRSMLPRLTTETVPPRGQEFPMSAPPRAYTGRPHPSVSQGRPRDESREKQKSSTTKRRLACVVM